MTNDKCKLEFNCPVCNPPKQDSKDIVKAMRNRLDDGRVGLWPTDQSLMSKAVTEIEKLRAYVRTLTGQLSHVGGISTSTVENVKRNLKIDGGWDLE